MKFILGVKQNMVQFFNEEGKSFPSTLLEVGPAVIVQIKTADKKDGYNAVVVGFGEKNAKNINKAQKGTFKDLGNFKHLKEFRVDNIEDFKVGDKIDASSFEVGDVIQVSSTSKGKGFQGVVKRHGFHGGPRSHGQKHTERAPGSIGATGPQRVFKGVRMGGRMGTDRVTVKNLKVLATDLENNQILISGAVPGIRGALVEIRS